jgi:sugar O-acyltransferase (sialic acid O-acetyltransferase NeuD family)
MKPTEIAIYGAGGFGREIAWLVQSCNQNIEIYKVVCFIDDDSKKNGQILNNIPIMSLEKSYEFFPSAKVVRAIGDPSISEIIVQKAANIGFCFETIMHPRIEKSEWTEIGLGSVICAGNIITTNIKIGKHVQVNLDCTIGHDSILDDFTTLAPGVHVSGWVHFGKRVYVGTGAVIINGISKRPIIIGENSVIGAGACVTKSVPVGATVVGVPAKPIRR